MGAIKFILTFIAVLSAILLIFFYFSPFDTTDFVTKTGSSNFSIIEGSNMQFYPNMRFSDSRISYRISDCPLQKEDDMEAAFDIMENITILHFYPVNNDEEISVTCEDRTRISNGMFIAGEGGPINITVAGNFDVIKKGEILLIKESECAKPNIALHELFHVLGFDHSKNPDNIMYNISKCDQTAGTDMIELINKLYAYSSYPDMMINNVSAGMKGKFLSFNLTALNAGLRASEKSSITIYADGNVIKEFDLEPLGIGQGMVISMSNILVPQIRIKELDVVLNYNFNELSKDNNKIKLEIKK